MIVAVVGIAAGAAVVATILADTAAVAVVVAAASVEDTQRGKRVIPPQEMRYLVEEEATEVSWDC